MRYLAISRPTGRPRNTGEPDDMDAEIANGRRLYEQGVIVEGYMDPGYSTAYFLIDAPDLDTVRAHLATYPQVRSGQSTYDVVQLIGLPAIAQSAKDHGQPLPAWWPPTANS